MNEIIDNLSPSLTLLAVQEFNKAFPPFLTQGQLIFYCSQNSAAIFIDGNPFILTKGRAVVAPYGALISCEQNKEQFKLICTMFRCNGENLNSEQSIINLEECHSSFIQLAENEDFDSFAYIFSKLQCHCAPSKKSAAVKRALSFIRFNYGSGVCVKQLGELNNRERTYFAHSFKTVTGITAIEYLTRYRLTCAKALLKKGFSVEKTAVLCGFTSPSSFITRFKKYFAVTPLQYKQNEKT